MKLYTLLGSLITSVIWLAFFLWSRSRWLHIIDAAMDALRDDEDVMKGCPRCQRMVARRTKQWLLQHTELKAR
jgi:hypothetical protein